MSRACHWATPVAIGWAGELDRPRACRDALMRLASWDSSSLMVPGAAPGPPAQLGGINQLAATGCRVGLPEGTDGSHPYAKTKTPARRTGANRHITRAPKRLQNCADGHKAIAVRQASSHW